MITQSPFCLSSLRVMSSGPSTTPPRSRACSAVVPPSSCTIKTPEFWGSIAAARSCLNEVNETNTSHTTCEDLLLHELLNSWLKLRGMVQRVDALPYVTDAKRSVADPFSNGLYEPTIRCISLSPRARASAMLRSVYSMASLTWSPCRSTSPGLES